MENPKPILAIIITILILFIGVYLFADKNNINLFNGKGGSTSSSDARRNVPVDAQLNSSESFSLSFDTSTKTQDITYTFVPSIIKVNNQEIRAKANQSLVKVSSFSGKVMIGNGSASLVGKGDNVQMGDFEFSGSNSIDIEGRIVNITLNSIQGDFTFNKVSGSFNVITNQSRQTFTIQDQQAQLKNFLGSLQVTKNGLETLTINGAVSKIVTPAFTISKDY